MSEEGEKINGISGKIIILNGTSSSGKTSIARALEHVLDEKCVYVSLDDVIEPIFTRYFSDIPPAEKMGEAGSLIIPRIVSLTHHTIAALALLNQTVIADVVINDKVWMAECIELFAIYPVTFVGVKCPLEELERRELARGDRHVGTAKSQFYTVHTDKEYDITVDTLKFNPTECAMQVKDALNYTQGGAFVRMKYKSIVIG